MDNYFAVRKQKRVGGQQILVTVSWFLNGLALCPSTMFVELIVNTITDGVVDSCTQQELNVVGRTDPSSVFFPQGCKAMSVATP